MIDLDKINGTDYFHLLTSIEDCGSYYDGHYICNHELLFDVDRVTEYVDKEIKYEGNLDVRSFISVVSKGINLVYDYWFEDGVSVIDGRPKDEISNFFEEFVKEILNVYFRYVGGNNVTNGYILAEDILRGYITETLGYTGNPLFQNQQIDISGICGYRSISLDLYGNVKFSIIFSDVVGRYNSLYIALYSSSEDKIMLLKFSENEGEYSMFATPIEVNNEIVEHVVSEAQHVERLHTNSVCESKDVVERLDQYKDTISGELNEFVQRICGLTEAVSSSEADELLRVTRFIFDYTVGKQSVLPRHIWMDYAVGSLMDLGGVPLQGSLVVYSKNLSSGSILKVFVNELHRARYIGYRINRSPIKFIGVTPDDGKKDLPGDDKNLENKSLGSEFTKYANTSSEEFNTFYADMCNLLESIPNDCDKDILFNLIDIVFNYTVGAKSNLPRNIWFKEIISDCKVITEQDDGPMFPGRSRYSLYQGNLIKGVLFVLDVDGLRGRGIIYRIDDIEKFIPVV